MLYCRPAEIREQVYGMYRWTRPLFEHCCSIRPAKKSIFVLLAAIDGGLDGVDLEAVLLLDPLPSSLLVARRLDTCNSVSIQSIHNSIASREE